MRTFIGSQSDMNKGGADIPMKFYTFQIDTPDEISKVFATVNDHNDCGEEIHFNFKPEDIPVGKPFIITVQCNVGAVINDYFYEYYVYATLYNSIEDYIKVVEQGIRDNYDSYLYFMEEQVIPTPFFMFD